MKAHFNENQKFDQWWIKLLLVVMLVISLIGPFQYFSGNQIPGAEPLWEIWVGVVAAVLVIWLLRSIQLQTKVYEDGIYFRFAPFQRRFKKLAWEELESVEIRKYNGLSEFGGWGLRYSIKGNGMAYTIRGSFGLQIKTKAGKKFMIGTQKAEELSNAISHFK